MAMANLFSHNIFLFGSLFLLMLVQIQTMVLCYQYKVGDLDSWGIPTSANPQVYTKWSKSHDLKIGDSLLFLYPPSEDSLIQVTKESYKSCNLKKPIMYMNNGNSLFNITSNGEYYFTSGEAGHCQKNQKIHVSVGGNGTSVDDDNAAAPSSSGGGGESSLPDFAPSYPTNFGSIPHPPSSSSSSSASSHLIASSSQIFVIGFVMCVLFSLP